MAISTFSHKTYNLGDLLNQIKIGNIALPDLQRPYIWQYAKTRDLFDSLFKGLPIGYILLWDTYTPGTYRKIGTDEKKMNPRFLVIDGQQRLTSLYSVVFGTSVVDNNFRKKEIKISFQPTKGFFEVYNAAIAKDIEWIANISNLFNADSDYRFIDEYIKRLKEKREISLEDEKIISENISRLKSILHYDISVLELMSNLDVEEVSEIFVRINSKGVVLKQSDFILTLMSVHWEEGRRQLETFCQEAKKVPEFESASPYNHLIKPLPEHIVRTVVGYSFLRGRLKYAYLTLQGKNLEEKSREISNNLRQKNFSLFKEGQNLALDLTNWHDFIKIISTAGFSNESMIPSKTTLFVIYSLYLIGKFKFKVEHKKLEKIIKKWFIFSLLTYHYSGSPETVIEEDLANFKKTNTDFVATLEKIINTNLTNDYWEVTLPQTLISSSTQNSGYVLYLASLCMLDANVMFSDLKLRDVLKDIEELKHKKIPIDRHHLFPKEYLNKIGITSQTEQNQVANFIHLEYKDNIQISDKAPKEYWGKLTAKLSNEEIKKIKEFYAIPDEFPEIDYQVFLEIRRKKMIKIIRRAFEKL